MKKGFITLGPLEFLALNRNKIQCGNSTQCLESTCEDVVVFTEKNFIITQLVCRKIST